MKYRKTYTYFMREYERACRFEGESRKRSLLQLLCEMEETYGLWLRMAIDEEGEAAGRLYEEMAGQVHPRIFHC